MLLIKPPTSNVISHDAITNSSFGTSENLCATLFLWYDKEHMNQVQIRLIRNVGIMIMLLTVSTNCLVVLTLVRTKQYQSTSMRLILYLAVCDGCSGLVDQPMFIYWFMRTSTTCHFKTCLAVLTTFFKHIPGYIVLLIAIDRYIRVRDIRKIHHRHVKNLTKVLVVIGTLLLALSHSMAQFTVYHVHHHQTQKVAQVITAECIFDMCVVAIILILYTMIMRKMKTIRTNSHNQWMSAAVDHTVHRTATSVMLAVCVCYTPWMIMVVANAIQEFQHVWLKFLFLVMYLLTSAHSFANAAICLRWNRKCRRSVIHSVAMCKVTVVSSFCGKLYPDLKSTQ